MRLWNSSVSGVADAIARSTCASPSTERRMDIPARVRSSLGSFSFIMRAFERRSYRGRRVSLSSPQRQRVLHHLLGRAEIVLGLQAMLDVGAIEMLRHLRHLGEHRCERALLRHRTLRSDSDSSMRIELSYVLGQR